MPQGSESWWLGPATPRQRRIILRASILALVTFICVAVAVGLVTNDPMKGILAFIACGAFLLIAGFALGIIIVFRRYKSG